MTFSSIGSEEDLHNNINDTTYTSSVTVPSLSTNCIGIVCVNLANVSGDQAVSSVTWNGDSMTYAIGINNGAAKRVEVWYRVNPDNNGTYDIVVSFASSYIRALSVVTVWASAGNAVSLDDTSTETGNAYDCDIVSTQAGTNELVIATSVSACNDLDSPVSPDATELQSWDSGGNCTISTYTTPASSGDTTHTHGYYDPIATQDYAMVSVSFKEAGGAAALEINIDPFTYGASGWKDGVLLWP